MHNISVLGTNVLHEFAIAGTYDGLFKLKAVPDPNVDPFQRWLPGVYLVKMGNCFSDFFFFFFFNYEYGTLDI